MMANNYKKLQAAIDFFSQSLHIEQLMVYGYDLVHRTLDLSQSALFMLEGSHYMMLQQKNYDCDAFMEPVTLEHKMLAERHGRVLTKDFDKYFSQALLDQFSLCFVIPVIDKDNLAGFILAGGLQCNGLDEAQMDLVHSINQLMNKAFENANAYSALVTKNQELDKRVFNLFFINHSARMLMAELHLNQLFSMCVDIVRELTASAVTSFFILDDAAATLKLKGYKNILNFDQRYEEIPITDPIDGAVQTVLSLREDKDQLQKIFGDLTVLESLNTEYVIFIVRERVLGLITISKPVNNQDYDQTILDLIVSIANSIYIAMDNAMKYEEIESQKQLLAAKMSAMETLNRSIKNIHACQSLEELSEIVLQTLKYGFGVSRAVLFLLDEQGRPYVLGSEGFSENPNISTLLLKGYHEKHVAYTRQHALDEIDFEAMAVVDRQLETNCLFYMPITMDITTEKGVLTLGGLYIDQRNGPMHPQDELAFETLSNTIAPFIYWQKRQEVYETQYTIKPSVWLMKKLSEADDLRLKYQLDYWIHFKQRNLVLPEVLNPASKTVEDPNHFYIGNLEILFANKPLPGEWLARIQGGDLESTLKEVYTIVT